MNYLEGIPYEEVINDRGKSYAEFRNTLHTNFKTPWVHIFSAILTIFCLILIENFLVQLFFPLRWAFIIVFSIPTGFFISYLNLFIHEAGHFYLHPNKKKNDLLANIFLCSWMGIEIKVYRKMHWQHHLHLASSSDMENSYFNPLTSRLLLETLTGFYLFKTLIKKKEKLQLSKSLMTRAKNMLVVGMALNILLIFLALNSDRWWLAITWIMAMIIFFPFFFTIRQVIEHRDELAKDDFFFYNNPRARISRIFSGSLFSRLFGPAGFNKHMIHHWDPNVPFSALADIETFLLECKRTEAIIKSSRTTYFSAFRKLFISR